MGKCITATMFTGFLFAVTANATGGNLVSVLKDTHGRDKALQVYVADPTDLTEFKQTFPEPISLSDKKTGLTLDFTCAADHCVFNFETKEKRYGQQLDEAIRSFETKDRSVTFPLWEAMQTPAVPEECRGVDAGCVEFHRKAVATHDGRFDLDCVRRKYDDHRGQYETVQCEATYNLRDLIR